MVMWLLLNWRIDDIAVSSITKSEYNEMYNTLMGGFESLSSSDDEYECDQKEQGDEDDPDYKPGDEESNNDEKDYEGTEYTYTESEEDEWDFNQEDSV